MQKQGARQLDIRPLYNYTMSFMPITMRFHLRHENKSCYGCPKDSPDSLESPDSSDSNDSRDSHSSLQSFQFYEKL